MSNGVVNKEYGLREPEFRDMEIGLRINLYRNIEDTLKDTLQGAEKTTQVTQDTTQATQGTIQVRPTDLLLKFKNICMCSGINNIVKKRKI